MAGTVVGQAVLELLGDSAQFRSEMDRAAARFKALGSELSSMGGALTRAVTLPLAGLGLAAGKAFIDFESSFAGIRKTMDLTEAEFGRLAQANRDMAKTLPVSVNELNRIGELAGQLGIRGVANVLKFEDTIAKLAVTTDLTADQAALAFAQISNVLQLPQDQIDRLGSTIVDLGNNFATTESRIVDFTQRIAGAGKIAGLTAGDVAGIGAAFASMGVEAEAGGSAVQKVLISMLGAVSQGNEELDVFALTAGMTASEFAAAFQQDAAGAFASFVEGLGRQGDAAIGTLEELGLQDQRLIRAFLGAAGAGDLLRQAIDRGNIAFIENTALTDEAAKRFETAASQLTVFWNRLKDVAITLGAALVPALTSALDASQPFLDVLAGMANTFAAMPKPLQTAVIGIAALAAALGPMLIVAGAVVSSFGALAALAGGIGISLAALAIPVALAVVAFGALVAAGVAIVDNWRIIKYEVSRMVDSIRDALVNRFNAIVESVRGKVDAVTGFFRNMYEAVVGSSYVPDMIEGIGQHFRRLHDLMVIPAELATDVVSAEMRDMMAVTQQTFSSATDAIANFAMGSKNALHNFVVSAIRDITRLIVKLLALRALQAVVAPSSFLATALNIPARASGGPVMRDRAYMVGERGPELFVPRTAGSIASNSAVRAAGGTQAPFVFDFSAFPAARNPLEAARDADWQRFLRTSGDVATSQGYTFR
jgi:TP901 family phage tail tape measure protein